METNDLKNLVKQKYAEIALNSSKSKGCGCGCSTDDNNTDYNIFSENYSKLDGYHADADLSLGCGIPTQFAKIKQGDTVLDLGSGAGNDCFVARSEVGESGKIIGIDFTSEMVEKARKNNEKSGYKNVEFILGDIEEMPIQSDTIDVVISNCVLNLVPDKKKAFAEIYRVLKPNGHFAVSDIVLTGELPEKVKDIVVLYAGCISGALQKNEYLKAISDAGFKNIMISKERQLKAPDELLLQYLSYKEMADYRNANIGIYSITVYGEK